MMKKIAVLLACIVGLFCFTRCEDNMDDLLSQKPEIEFLAEEGYCHADGNFYVNTEINFMIQATPNTSSKSPLASFNFSIIDLNGNDLVDESITVASDTLLVTKSFSSAKEGTYLITATVTDAAGKVNAAEIHVTLIDPNAGVIGRYEGAVDIAGEVVFDTLLPQQHVTLDSLHACIILSSSTEPDMVNAIFEIEGEPYSVQCHKNGNQLEMEEIHLTRVLAEINNLQLDFLINITGTLDGDRLEISGPAIGTGQMNFLIFNVHANMEGQIEGVLEKVPEEE